MSDGFEPVSGRSHNRQTNDFAARTKIPEWVVFRHLAIPILRGACSYKCCPAADAHMPRHPMANPRNLQLFAAVASPYGAQEVAVQRASASCESKWIG